MIFFGPLGLRTALRHAPAQLLRLLFRSSRWAALEASRPGRFSIGADLVSDLIALLDHPVDVILSRDYSRADYGHLCVKDNFFS